jgi:hypothetical protein
MNALEAHAAKQSTTVLADSLAILAGLGRTLTTEERMARGAIISALESRYPELDAVTLAWCETADTTRTYEDVIFSALKDLGVTA